MIFRESNFLEDILAEKRAKDVFLLSFHAVLALNGNELILYFVEKSLFYW